MSEKLKLAAYIVTAGLLILFLVLAVRLLISEDSQSVLDTASFGTNSPPLQEHVAATNTISQQLIDTRSTQTPVRLPVDKRSPARVAKAEEALRVSEQPFSRKEYGKTHIILREATLNFFKGWDLDIATRRELNVLAQIYFKIGRCLELQHKYSSAEEHFAEAMRIAPCSAFQTAKQRVEAQMRPKRRRSSRS